MAAWLWNTREEYAMSHALSRWLLDEATAVGDTEAIELGHRYCALSVPTKLGRIGGQPALTPLVIAGGGPLRPGSRRGSA